jgi:hypothetical protein
MKPRLSFIYLLSLCFGEDGKFIYIGSREKAQRHIADLIDAANGRLSPISFRLEKITTDNGIVVEQQNIDI